MSQAYNWGGYGPSDCSGDASKRARQYNDGMQMEEILQGVVDDYAEVLDRIQARKTNP